MTLQHLSVANESLIAYQGRSFLYALSEAVTRYRNTRHTDKDKSDFAIEVDRLIGEFTNIHNHTTISSGKECYMASPIVGRGNVLSGDNAKLIREYDLRNNTVSEGRIEGFIDGLRGRVDGDFAKLKHKMVIGSQILLSKESPEQVATRIIHEVGHGYGYLAHAAVLMVRCYHLESAFNSLHAGDGHEKFKIVIDRARERMGLRPSEVVKHVNGKAEDVFRVAAVEITEDMYNKDPRSLYTYDTAEELADIFATRHGCGPHLANLRLSDPENNGETFFQQNRSNMFAMIVIGALAGSTVIGTAVVASYGALVGFGLAYTLFRKEKTTAEQAINNIRNELIASLKERGLKDAELLKDIDAVSAALAVAMRDVNTDYVRKALNLIVPGRSRAIAVREYNDALANMANNDLFVAAAKLQAAAK